MLTQTPPAVTRRRCLCFCTDAVVLSRRPLSVVALCHSIFVSRPRHARIPQRRQARRSYLRSRPHPRVADGAVTSRAAHAESGEPPLCTDLVLPPDSTACWATASNTQPPSKTRTCNTSKPLPRFLGNLQGSRFDPSSARGLK